jgi:hypothetical protein
MREKGNEMNLPSGVNLPFSMPQTYINNDTKTLITAKSTEENKNTINCDVRGNNEALCT